MRIRVLPYQFRNPSEYRTRAVLYVHVLSNSPFKRECNFETARTLLRKHVWYVIMQLLVWRDSVPGDSKRKVQWMYACKNLEHICLMLYEATTPWVVWPCDGNFPQDFQIKDCLPLIDFVNWPMTPLIFHCHLTSSYFSNFVLDDYSGESKGCCRCFPKVCFCWYQLDVKVKEFCSRNFEGRVMFHKKLRVLRES